jgi:tetratricopeptide (TPR) repeat protein
MAKKIKISRKQMKQPDDFVSATEKLMEWAEENLLIVGGGVLLIIVVFLGANFVKGSVKKGSMKPANDLAAAMHVLDAEVKTFGIDDGMPINPLAMITYSSEKEKYQAAIDKLEPVITNHKGSPEADMALLYLANSHEEIENYAKAADYYNQYANSELGKKRAVYYKHSGLLGSARCDFRLGNYKKSLETSTVIIESDSPFKEEALILASKANFENGNAEAAQKNLDTLKEEFPESWNTQVADYLITHWKEIKKNEEDGAGSSNIKINIPETKDGMDELLPE